VRGDTLRTEIYVRETRGKHAVERPLVFIADRSGQVIQIDPETFEIDADPQNRTDLADLYKRVSSEIRLALR
jgi:hypothetical protein